MPLKRIMIRIVFLVFSLAFLAPRLSFAGDDQTNFRLSAGVSYLNGYLTYSIGDHVDFPGGSNQNLPGIISQLKFPINTLALELLMGYRVLPPLDIEVHLRKNFPLINGKMEDTDWSYWYLSGYFWGQKYTKDIFSQSDATLDMLSAGIQIRFDFIQLALLTIGLQGGFDYDSYHYDVRDTDQWYPSYNNYKLWIPVTNNQHDRSYGSVLTYQVNKLSGLIGLGIGLDFGIVDLDAGIEGILGDVMDSDDHILMKKLSTGSLFLYGARANMGVLWRISGLLSLDLGAQVEYDQAKGLQTQTSYQTTNGVKLGTIGTIDEYWESLFVIGGVHLTYKF